MGGGAADDEHFHAYTLIAYFCAVLQTVSRYSRSIHPKWASSVQQGSTVDHPADDKSIIRYSRSSASHPRAVLNGVPSGENNASRTEVIQVLWREVLEGFPKLQSTRLISE